MSTSFDTQTSRWLVERNFAELVKAADLGEAHIGRGLLHELWRDHQWDYISRIERTSSGLIEIEHLEPGEPTKKVTTEGNTTTTVTEYTVKHVVETFNPDALICITPFDGGKKVERPQARRVTEVVTKIVTVERLAD